MTLDQLRSILNPATALLSNFDNANSAAGSSNFWPVTFHAPPELIGGAAVNDRQGEAAPKSVVQTLLI